MKQHFLRSYHKTNEVIKTTAEKTSSLFSGFTNKLSQMKNSDSFKSFEGKVGGAYESVKVSFMIASILSFSNSWCCRQKCQLRVQDRFKASTTSPAPQATLLPHLQSMRKSLCLNSPVLVSPWIILSFSI